MTDHADKSYLYRDAPQEPNSFFQGIAFCLAAMAIIVGCAVINYLPVVLK